MGMGGNAVGSVIHKVRKGLFTKEDPGNVHKSLGIFALLHFIYRFANMGPSDMKFEANNRTLVCLGLHAALSSTSLIFRIPLKRITEGSRIWPEYRLHSITFAFRSLACCMIVYVERIYNVATPRYELNALVVICTMLAADFGSWYVGPAGRSSTIQDLDAPPFMRFFFSVMQFHATTGCLVGVRRFSTQFAYVWIIQFTAFLMTLRRKNLAPHGPLVTVYGLMLVSGFVVSTYDLTTAGCWLLANTLAPIAYLMRVYLRMDKYLMWSLVAAALHFLRPYAVVKEDSLLAPRIAAWFVATAACAAFGVRKVRIMKERDAEAAAAAAKEKAS